MDASAAARAPLRFRPRGLKTAGGAGPRLLMVPLLLVAAVALTPRACWAAESVGAHGTAAQGTATHGAAQGGGHGGGHGEHGGAAEETPAETFVILDLFSEALEASVAGVGIKIAELKPKVEHINKLYQDGERHRAFAKILGISTEVILLGFLIETFGVGELFISALSFSGNWATQLAQSTAGILISTKASLLAGEKVEEVAEEKYEHAIHAEAAKKAGASEAKAESKPKGGAAKKKKKPAEPHESDPHGSDPHVTNPHAVEE